MFLRNYKYQKIKTFLSTLFTLTTLLSSVSPMVVSADQVLVNYGFTINPESISLSGIVGQTDPICGKMNVQNTTSNGDGAKTIVVKNVYGSSIRVWDQTVQQTGGYFFYETDNSTLESQVCIDPNGLAAGLHTDQLAYKMYNWDNSETSA